MCRSCCYLDAASSDDSSAEVRLGGQLLCQAAALTLARHSSKTDASMLLNRRGYRVRETACVQCSLCSLTETPTGNLSDHVSRPLAAVSSSKVLMLPVLPGETKKCSNAQARQHRVDQPLVVQTIPCVENRLMSLHKSVASTLPGSER